MTPREIIALAIGVLVGAFLNARTEPCRRACCVAQDRSMRRDLWMRGEDPALLDAAATLHVLAYMNRFIDQTMDELHEAALWIDDLLTRA